MDSLKLPPMADLRLSAENSAFPCHAPGGQEFCLMSPGPQLSPALDHQAYQELFKDRPVSQTTERRSKGQYVLGQASAPFP